MKTTNNFFKVSFLMAIFVASACLLTTEVIAVSSPQVQTNSATNIQYDSAVLNGSLVGLGGATYTNIWFQWGTSTSYGNETTHQASGYPEVFSHTINNLAPNTTFHFRAVAQNSYGTVYGSDMVFSTGQSGNQQVTANAGPDLYINLGQSTTLQGSGYENSGNPINYHWSCNGGTLSNPDIAQPAYNPPYAIGQGTYSCTLTVTNNYGSSDSDSTTVYVNYSGGSFYVQTNSATNIYSNQATLNGFVSGSSYFNNYVWFQWGTSTSYGNETNRQTLIYSGSFSKNISGLANNTTYHYRAVAQNLAGSTVYGQDMTFNTGYSSGSSSLLISKKVINLTSGNLNWQASVNAKPYDVLSFAITLQASGKDVHNIYIKDILPANLIYKGNMTVNASLNYSGNLTSGINIGTIPAGEIAVVAYQVQVAPPANFPYGATVLNNNLTITSDETSAQNALAQVLVTNSLVQGAANLPTGLTNKFFTDSFFLPLFLIILGLWFYFSGNAYRFADWLKSRR